MASTIEYVKTLENRYPHTMRNCHLSRFLGSVYEALGYPEDWGDNFIQRWKALSPSAKQRVYDCWHSGGGTIERARMAAGMVA